MRQEPRLASGNGPGEPEIDASSSIGNTVTITSLQPVHYVAVIFRYYLLLSSCATFDDHNHTFRPHLLWFLHYKSLTGDCSFPPSLSHISTRLPSAPIRHPKPKPKLSSIYQRKLTSKQERAPVRLTQPSSAFSSKSPV